MPICVGMTIPRRPRVTVKGAWYYANNSGRVALIEPLDLRVTGVVAAIVAMITLV